MTAQTLGSVERSPHLACRPTALTTPLRALRVGARFTVQNCSFRNLSSTAVEATYPALVDINLRGKLCFPVADARADRHIPFVFATGYTIAQVPGRHANVPRFEKPTAPGVICRALEGAMESGGDGSPRG